MFEVAQSLAAAIERHQAGQLAEAERIYREILAREPDHADSLHLLGVLACQNGEYSQAVDLIRAAVKADPSKAVYHSNLGEALRGLGRLDEAVAAFEQAIRLKPDFAGAYYNLGNVLKALRRLTEAVAAYRKAVHIQPAHYQAHNNLGNTLRELGEVEEVVDCFRRAIAANPQFLDAHNNLGNALSDLERPSEAIASFQFVLQHDPKHAAAHCNLGNAYRAQGRFREAVDCYHAALASQPEFAEAHYNLAYALQEQGLFSEGVASLRRAVQIRPDYHEAHNNLGVALRDQGLIAEAIEAFQDALRNRPGHVAAHSNLVFTMQYRNRVTLAELAAAHREFDRQHAAMLTEDMATSQRAVPHSHTRGGRLRLGFVSADLRRHPVAFFLAPVLENLAGQDCEVTCYCDNRRQDTWTERIRSAAGVWRQVDRLSNDQLAEQIRSDRIEILFDLAGHTAHNRLLVFARRPAPVQIAWVGYPGTTGLTAMDYILADQYVIPVEAECHYRERVLRMPLVYSCYAPPGDAPAVSPLPALRNGYVTFGSFNNPAKIGPELIEVWARILHKVPMARLLLRYGNRYTRETAARYRASFAALGISPQRIELSGERARKNLLEEYQRVDIALDPFPYSGATTTCEALWMGVPVITCLGATFASRQSFSFLSAAVLLELITADLDEYVARAAGLASDLGHLAGLRSQLRSRMAASPLCDGKRFAADFLETLRQVPPP
jgi:predicted O-linked N-acetylglucosamine transferase (SPINDLY family)